jgi:hypothetical protein
MYVKHPPSSCPPPLLSLFTAFKKGFLFKNVKTIAIFFLSASFSRLRSGTICGQTGPNSAALRTVAGGQDWGALGGMKRSRPTGAPAYGTPRNASTPPSWGESGTKHDEILTESTLIKKKINFSSYIRKFRVEQLQSHI